MSLARRLPILPKVAGNSLSALCCNHPFPLRPPPVAFQFFFSFKSCFLSPDGARQKKIDSWSQKRLPCDVERGTETMKSIRYRAQSKSATALARVLNPQGFRSILFSLQLKRHGVFVQVFVLFFLNNAKPFFLKSRSLRLQTLVPVHSWAIVPHHVAFSWLTKLLRSSTRTFTRTSVAHCSPCWSIQPMCVSRSSLATFPTTRPRDIHTDLFKKGRFSFNFLHIHKRVSHPRSRFPFQLQIKGTGTSQAFHLGLCEGSKGVRACALHARKRVCLSVCWMRGAAGSTHPPCPCPPTLHSVFISPRLHLAFAHPSPTRPCPNDTWRKMIH